jgi:hypothetical protein
VVAGNEAQEIVGTGERDCQSSKLSTNPTQAIRTVLSGSTEAAALGLVARTHAPVLELCRRLLTSGANPSAPLECFRHGVLCLVVRSVSGGAVLAVQDDRFGHPRFVRRRLRSDGTAPRTRQNGMDSSGDQG